MPNELTYSITKITYEEPTENNSQTKELVQFLDDGFCKLMGQYSWVLGWDLSKDRQ